PPPPPPPAAPPPPPSPPLPPPHPDDSDPESRPPRAGSRPSRSPSRHPAPHERPPPPEGERPSRAAGGGGGSDDGKAEEAEAARRPWNLRPRRAANPPPLSSRNGEALHDAAGGAPGGDKENYAQQQLQPKSVRLRGLAGEGERKEKKRKFWISLSKEEIEEDIFIMTGSRPARRPRKRPKNEQKQLDIVFPGLWLVGLTPDAYRVAEAPAKPAKR
ncbi:proline-rich protein 2, partial [Eucalyptus grandis]|uniref:proline-rich protein 2 n=1 Tax=Eucalyptus grandis TaxID=71139 RepID=UPI00192EFFD7